MDSLTNLNISNRKIRKPLMERKRRARINRSLDELYQLLTEADFASKGTKLEKADILEMTVQYLKQVKQNDYSREIKENAENVMLERYLLGFERCAEEIETLVDPQLKHKISWHLKNRLEKVKTQQKNNLATDKKDEAEDLARSPWKSANACSVLVQQPKFLRILPSKFPNGDALLLLSSSNVVSCEKGLSKGEMWRPWW